MPRCDSCLSDSSGVMEALESASRATMRYTLFNCVGTWQITDHELKEQEKRWLLLTLKSSKTLPCWKIAGQVVKSTR